ncbi:MAG TPA: DUF4398 domain-containing protein [Kofleriaceae bacterium]|nr:DUF4398 domain-containing protein [Kofleriaceae bacterium]
MGRRWFAIAAALSAALGSGCGPIVYASQVHQASTAVETARAAHADQLAPYWWTRATQYLEKAREVAAYADFQGANRFGLLATEAADKATAEAQAAATKPATDAAPAKAAP